MYLNFQFCNPDTARCLPVCYFLIYLKNNISKTFPSTCVFIYFNCINIHLHTHLPLYIGNRFFFLHLSFIHFNFHNPNLKNKSPFSPFVLKQWTHKFLSNSCFTETSLKALWDRKLLCDGVTKILCNLRSYLTDRNSVCWGYKTLL
jgi:hypothetical protein